MQLHFTKMHGAGNDFVVIDLISQDYTALPAGRAQASGPTFGRRLRSGTDSGAAAQSTGGLPVPYLQRRRQRGSAVRQWRSLLRPVRPGQEADPQADNHRGNSRRRYSTARPPESTS